MKNCHLMTSTSTSGSCCAWSHHGSILKLFRVCADCGVDGVKVDVQGTVGMCGKGFGGGAAISRRFHDALEDSVQQHFPGNHMINCMCHDTQDLYRYLPAVALNSSCRNRDALMRWVPDHAARIQLGAAALPRQPHDQLHVPRHPGPVQVASSCLFFVWLDCRNGGADEPQTTVGLGLELVSPTCRMYDPDGT